MVLSLVGGPIELVETAMVPENAGVPGEHAFDDGGIVEIAYFRLFIGHQIHLPCGIKQGEDGLMAHRSGLMGRIVFVEAEEKLQLPRQAGMGGRQGGDFGTQIREAVG